MVKNSTLFGAVAAPPLQVSLPATLNSVFVGQSGLSPTLPAGGNFAVQLTFQNPVAGATWNSSTVKLVKQDGANPCSFGVSEIPLATNVSAGGSFTFTINGVAPALAQTCTFQWQMRDVGTFFGAQFSQQVSFTVAGYDAIPQSVVLPSSLIQGQRFDATISILNPSGSAAWDLRASAGADQVILGSQSPSNNLTWGANTASSVATTVSAGSTAAFTVSGRAPVAVGGPQVFDWQLRRGSSAWFGGIARPATQPNVFAGSKNAQEIEMTVPAQVNSGDVFTATVRVKNTGTAVWWGLGVSAANPFRLRHSNAQSPNRWGTSAVNLQANYVDSNDTAVFTFSLTAPDDPGIYGFSWRMEQLGFGDFGPEISRQVEVRAVNPGIRNISPIGGNGVENTFSAKFVGGQSTVHTARFLLNDGGAAHCWLEYNQSMGRIIIYNANTGQREFGVPGAVQTIANDYCYVKTGDSSVDIQGNVTTVSLRAGFKTPMSGSKNFWVSLLNGQMVDTGWLYQGSYVIPAQVGISISPTSILLSSGQGTQFTPTVTGSSSTSVLWNTFGQGAVTAAGYYTADTVTSTQNATLRVIPSADTSRYADAGITVQPNPSIVSITNFSPTNGEGRNRVFTIVANGGNAPVHTVTFYANTTQMNSGGCIVTWFVSAQWVTLSSNGGGSSGGQLYNGYLNNSYCGINLTASSGFYQGNTATLNLSVDYTPWSWYHGWISHYAKASTLQFNMADYQYFGYWWLP